MDSCSSSSLVSLTEDWRLWFTVREQFCWRREKRMNFSSLFFRFGSKLLPNRTNINSGVFSSSTSPWFFVLLLSLTCASCYSCQTEEERRRGSNSITRGLRRVKVRGSNITVQSTSSQPAGEWKEMVSHLSSSHREWNEHTESEMKGPEYVCTLCVPKGNLKSISNSRMCTQTTKCFSRTETTG